MSNRDKTSNIVGSLRMLQRNRPQLQTRLAKRGNEQAPGPERKYSVESSLRPTRTVLAPLAGGASRPPAKKTGGLTF